MWRVSLLGRRGLALTMEVLTRTFVGSPTPPCHLRLSRPSSLVCPAARRSVQVARAPLPTEIPSLVVHINPVYAELLRVFGPA